jgi:iron(III) transport system permease protein
MGFFIAAATLLPILYLVVRAAGMGAEMWQIVTSAHTVWILIRSAALAVSVTAGAVVLGVFMAWLTSRTNLPGGTIWTISACLPLAVPSYVGAFAILSALGPMGLLQQALEPFGVDRLPSIYGFPGAWLTLTLYTYPYVFLTVRTALLGTDRAFEDIARTLGKSTWQVFRDIELPQVLPAVRAGAILSALYTLSDFGAVSLMQCNVFTRAIYVQYIASLNLGTAAVLALMLVGLTMLFLLVQEMPRRTGVYYRSGAGARRRPQRLALGGWRIPALTVCGSLAAMALGLPILVICIWLARGIHAGEPLLASNLLLWHSFSASATAAAIAAVFAMPVVILIVRRPGRMAWLIERTAYLGHALPGIVIALALVFFSARYLKPVYQSMALLVAAYVIRFIPHAISSLRASMLQINPLLEEAARTLGKSTRRATRDIVIPLLRPGFLMGAAMVFLSCMKELPATLMLSPTGFETLATRIWSATEEAFFARAALPSLILIGVSAVSVWMLLEHERETLSR